MRWLFFVFSAAAFAVAFRTHSIGLATFCLLVGLGLMLAGVIALASHRIGSRSRHEGQILGPEELRALREQAEQRKQAGAEGPGTAATLATTAGARGEGNGGSGGD